MLSFKALKRNEGSLDQSRFLSTDLDQKSKAQRKEVGLDIKYSHYCLIISHWKNYI